MVEKVIEVPEVYIQWLNENVMVGKVVANAIADFYNALMDNKVPQELAFSLTLMKFQDMLDESTES